MREGEVCVDCEKLRSLLLERCRLTLDGIVERAQVSRSVVYRMLGGPKNARTASAISQVQNVRCVLSVARQILEVDEAVLPMSTILWKSTATVSAARWTGISSRHDRASAVQILIPLAAEAIEVLIQNLENGGHNGGPRLPEIDDALSCLRKLHHALGQILASVDDHGFDDDLGEGLIAEAVRYAARASQLLRNDPLPFVLTALITSICAVCGHPTAGAIIGGVTVQVRKAR